MIDLPSDKVYQEQMNQMGYETGYIVSSMYLNFAILALGLVRIIID